MKIEEIEIKEDKKESIQIGPSNHNRICQVCKRNHSKYTCPRCNIAYCCLDCYKKHNEGSCGEYFYQKNIEEALKESRVSDDQKKNFAKILMRNYVEGKDSYPIKEEIDEEEMVGEDSDEEEEILPNSEEELKRLLKRMNLDEGDLDAELSVEEQVDFIRALTDGRMGRFIIPWIPWWSDVKDFVQSDPSLPPPTPSKPPVIKKDVPLLSSLTKAQPSKLLAFNLIDILYSYCYSMRIFNGDLDDLDAKEAAVSVLELSSVLSQNRVYQTSVEVLQFIVEGSVEYSSASNTAGFAVDVLHDVSTILSKSNYILSALSDLLVLFERSEEELKKENDSKQTKELKKKISMSSKKILFYLSWVNDQLSQKESAISSTIFDSLSEKTESYWTLQKEAIEMRNNKK